MKTKIPFQPMGNRIVVRADFKVSTLNILNMEELSKITPEKYTVVAVSDEVTKIQLDDIVRVDSVRGCPRLLNFDWNDQSLETKQNIHQAGKNIVGLGTVPFSEYFIVDVIDVLGIVIPDSSKC